jgi:hypothetical protein
MPPNNEKERCEYCSCWTDKQELWDQERSGNVFRVKGLDGQVKYVGYCKLLPNVERKVEDDWCEIGLEKMRKERAEG